MSEPASRRALAHIRVCDFSGILAGAGATKFLAAFGAEIIRVEDPVRQGRWDVVRGNAPFKDERRGINMGGGFNNHNVGKLGVTINLKHERGKALTRKLISTCDVVTENFASGVLARLGFSYEDMRAVKPDIIYVTNCGFGYTGPYHTFKSFGPIAQAASGLTFASGHPDMEPAGYGYSYMDHTGAYYGVMAIMLALYHKSRTGEGQYVDVAASEAGAVLHGPALLDYTVNGRRMRRPGMPDTNHSPYPAMAPHNIYPAAGDDEWIAIACRTNDEWRTLTRIVEEAWTEDPALQTVEGRLLHQAKLDHHLAEWTAARDKHVTASQLKAAGMPAEPVRRPEERIDQDPNTEHWGLWPTVEHTEIGHLRVDGIPLHLSETDWHMRAGGPCLGEHNDYVFGELLGLDHAEIDALKAEGAI